MSRMKEMLPVSLLLLLSGCVTQRDVKLNPDSRRAQSDVKVSNLSDYVRVIYKLSSEASKQAEERATLLSDAPELEPTIDQAEANPMDAEARSRVVSEYMSRKLYWGAYQLLTNTLPDQGNDPDIDMNLAIIWDAWGQYDLALQYGERAITNGMATPQAFETMGRISLHRNEPDQAIIWYNQSLEHSRNASVLTNLGYAHMLKSDWEKSRSNLEEAIALDDALQEAHNNLAIVLSKTGDDTGALAHLLQTGRPAVAFNNLGVLYVDEKRLPDAQHYFEEALRLEPDYVLARRNLDAIQASTPLPPIFDVPTLLSTPVSPMTESSPATTSLGHSNFEDLEVAATDVSVDKNEEISINEPDKGNSAGTPPSETNRIALPTRQQSPVIQSFEAYSLAIASFAGLALVAALFVRRSRDLQSGNATKGEK